MAVGVAREDSLESLILKLWTGGGRGVLVAAIHSLREPQAHIWFSRFKSVCKEALEASNTLNSDLGTLGRADRLSRVRM